MLRDTRTQVDRRLEEIASSDLPLPSEPLGLVARVINLRPAVDRITAPIDQVKRDFGAASTALGASRTVRLRHRHDRLRRAARRAGAHGPIPLDAAALRSGRAASARDVLLRQLRAAGPAHRRRSIGVRRGDDTEAGPHRASSSCDSTPPNARRGRRSPRRPPFATVFQTEQSIFVAMGLRDGASSDQATVAPDFLNASTGRDGRRVQVRRRRSPRARRNRAGGRPRFSPAAAAGDAAVVGARLVHRIDHHRHHSLGRASACSKSRSAPARSPKVGSTVRPLPPRGPDRDRGRDRSDQRTHGEPQPVRRANDRVGSGPTRRAPSQRTTARRARPIVARHDRATAIDDARSS